MRQRPPNNFGCVLSGDAAHWITFLWVIRCYLFSISFGGHSSICMPLFFLQPKKREIKERSLMEKNRPKKIVKHLIARKDGIIFFWWITHPWTNFSAINWWRSAKTPERGTANRREEEHYKQRKVENRIRGSSMAKGQQKVAQ